MYFFLKVVALYLRSNSKRFLCSGEETEDKKASAYGDMGNCSTDDDGTNMYGQYDVIIWRMLSDCIFNCCTFCTLEKELDYVGALNRALPPDIRVLGWSPVGPGFSARSSFFPFSGSPSNWTKKNLSPFAGSAAFPENTSIFSSGEIWTFR